MTILCIACGVEFSSPVITYRSRDGNNFYCPNGHSMYFKDARECPDEVESNSVPPDEVSRQVETLEALYKQKKGWFR